MKTLLLGLALCLPFQLIAADDDSVYSWGPWAEGIKPAAGVVASITPAPVDQPDVSFRPNENAAFSRSVVRQTPVLVTPAINEQVPGIATVSSDTDLSNSNPGGSNLFNP